ncbi:hypothetical protein [Nonomuraea zeae]|uniref:Uncharacterized protein n=1 Tax=Nonomuraea zeae TaxID=1642303 RepID=A0A5S4GV58_9ACTN|nr:hypothetical protein [Nonomuraea zeae]TMR30310.1 hypothetical protein ETD85_29530 [Nonomuraea zeae]
MSAFQEPIEADRRIEPCAGSGDHAALWAVRPGRGTQEGHESRRRATAALEALEALCACHGGTGGPCRVRLISGEVGMEQDYALEPGELVGGYVVIRQSHPVTPGVRVDFDA